MRVGQVADAMRVRAGVAPRVASGDPAASKGKSAGGASFGKRRVGQEERCAATHARCYGKLLGMTLTLVRVFAGGLGAGYGLVGGVDGG